MLIERLKKKKFLLFNIFFTLYIGINLIGGERGLISYFDKKNTFEKLILEEKVLTAKLKDFEGYQCLNFDESPFYPFKNRGKVIIERSVVPLFKWEMARLSDFLKIAAA